MSERQWRSCANRPSRQARPLTASLGYRHPDRLDETLATVLGKIIEDKPLNPGEGIIHQEEGVDLLPANIDLVAMEVTLVNIMSRETILREYLKTVRDQYDVKYPTIPWSAGRVSIIIPRISSCSTGFKIIPEPTFLPVFFRDNSSSPSL